MSTTSSATFDPVSTATQLATAYTANARAAIKTQGDQATATAAAITRLRSALTEFTGALGSLSAKKSVIANVASFSDTALGSASAGASATPGSYSLFVEQVARAHQVSFGGLSDGATASNNGTLAVTVGASTFNVNLSAADKNGNGQLSPTEIAAAINTSAGNTSLVTASIVSANGLAQLVLTSNNSGAANTIGIDTSAMSAGSIKAALDTPANYQELATARDAIVWLGAQGSGTRIQQAANSFTNIAGVTMNFTKAQAGGDPPVTLTVANDPAGTAANVQAFIAAYNKLEGVLDTLTASGDPSKGMAAAIYANDAGVNALRSHLVSSIRQAVGSATLTRYGVTGLRDGSLTLNTARLNAALAADPDGLNAAFGSSTLGNKAGVMGDLDTYMNMWTSSVNGQLSGRQGSVSRLQSALSGKQARLDAQYDSAYKRYLAQFTRLQQLQDQMSHTSGMFDAIFNNNKG